MNGRSVAALAACAAAAAALAQEAPPGRAALADAAFGSDTDGLHSFRARAGGLIAYSDPWNYTGVAVQSTRFTHDDFRQDVAAVVGLYRAQRRDTLAGVDIEAGVARVSGRLRPVGDATWRFLLPGGTAIDLGASADLVETRLALQRGIGYTFVSAGAEQPIGERFTATALGGLQSFSDGNVRTHLRARLIWLAVPEAGVTAQLRYRRYTSRDDDVGGAYFNPRGYHQWLAVAAIRKRHEGWVWSGALGAGKERSTGTGSQTAYLAEARGEGELARDVRLVLRAGYQRSAGFAAGPDYASRFAGAGLVFAFR